MRIPGVGPDVEQSLAHIIALTTSHNLYPIMLVIAACAVLASALYSPTRSKILLFVGLLCLVGHFEYVKHVKEPLMQQTLVTTATEVPNYKYMWITERIISKGIPLMLLVSGIGCTGSSLFLIFRGYMHRKQKHLQ